MRKQERLNLIEDRVLRRLFGKREGGEPFGRHKRRWENVIKVLRLEVLTAGPVQITAPDSIIEFY
jgi:hypothetical protein